MTHLDGRAESGVAWATVSDMPLARFEPDVRPCGWTLPFYSSRGTTFSPDCGVGGGFLLSVFLRDGDEVFRTSTAGCSRHPTYG